MKINHNEIRAMLIDMADEKEGQGVNRVAWLFAIGECAIDLAAEAVGVPE